MPLRLSCLFVALAVLLAGCAPARPSLASVDLESALVVAGDLPSGLSGAQIRDQAPEMFADVPPAIKAAYQQLARADATSGGVTVLLYEQAGDRDAAYAEILDGMGSPGPVGGIGDEAHLLPVNEELAQLAGLAFADLLFRRCSAVAHIRMSARSQVSGLTDEITAYARRLDARLAELACP